MDNPGVPEMHNPGALAASIVEAMADPLLGPDGKCES
jgi:hypothetical protein